MHVNVPGMIITMIIRAEGVRWAVRLSVTRRGGWRDWGAVSGQFERQLAAQASGRILAPHIDSESRRGSDHVRITVQMNVLAADVAEALSAAWWAFRKAADDGWDLTGAMAEVRPGGQLSGPVRTGGNVTNGHGDGTSGSDATGTEAG